MTIFQSIRGKGLRPLPHLLLAGALALPLAGCDTDEIVAVEDPAQLQPGQIDNPEAIPALVNGAVRQFIGGYSGFGDDAFLSASAVLSDEFYYGDTFTTRNAADQRNTQAPVLGNISDAAFSRLQQARLNARRTFAQIERYTPTDTQNKSLLRTIEGYVYVTLGEGWCGAIPFSTFPETGTIDPKDIGYGMPLGTAQVNDTAVARFNEALALNANNRLAALGKARALVNLGRYAEAAAAVTNVPTTYVYHLEHSSNVGSQNNPIFSLQSNGRYGVSNLEGAQTSATVALRPDLPRNADPGSTPVITVPTTATSAEGLAFRGMRDPRVPWEGRAARNSACFSSSVTCFLNLNYPSFNADVPLASGVEARLIEAEAALQAGNPSRMLEILNALRSDVAALTQVLYTAPVQSFPRAPAPPSLPALTDPATATMTSAQQLAARRALLFQERALWLFNTGHRQGDLRRLVRNYGLPSNQVFPSGPYFRGGTYGNDVAYPIPFNEENNPEYAEAIEQCVTTQA